MKTVHPLALALVIAFVNACSTVPLTNLPSPTQIAGPSSTSVPPAVASDVAEIIFTNGFVITMDEANPHAESLAVRGNSILAVGTNGEIAKYRGANTTVVDLGGRTLVPGFIDAHQYRIQKRANVGITDARTIIQDAIEQGWTTLDELYVDEGLINELRELDQAGTLRLRVNAYLPFMQYNANGTKLGDWYEAYRPGQMISPHVRVAGLIGFADYDNATILLWQQNDLNAFLLKAQQEGWNVALKTVSTRSLEMILNGYEFVSTLEPQVVNSRGRLEHALFITSDQIARIKHLGLIPIINLNNPGQLVGEQDVDALIAREPQDSYTPWRKLEQAGLVVANGTGWPSYYVDELAGAPFGSPVHLLYQGVTRVGNHGQMPYPWLLDQAITAEDALRALTFNAAYADFEDTAKGSLRAGQIADVVILSDNPLGVATEQINNIRVLMTMIGGKAEYCAEAYVALCSSAGSSDSVPASPAPASYPSATASAYLPESPPSNAVDGNPDTLWNAGAHPEQWIQIDLGQQTTVSVVRLVISQDPSGETIHQLWAGSDANSLSLIHEFNGVTAETGALEFKPSSPLTNIRYIKVVTTQSPSWVAWREIEVTK